MVKGFPSDGLHECQRNQTETESGTAGATQLIPGKGPSNCPRTPPGTQGATSAGSLFIISDSSGCQCSALYRANTALAHHCRKALKKVSQGRENTGSQCGSCNRRQVGGTFCGHSLCVASCSGPLSCSAAWGQANEAFFSPPVPAHGGPGKGLFKGTRHL